MPTIPPKLSSFAASHSHSSSSSSHPSHKPLQDLRSSSNSHSVPPSTSARLARQLHDWLCDESQSLSTSLHSPLPSVTYLQSTVRNQQTAQLYQFLVQLHHSPPAKQTTPSSSSASPSSSSSQSAVHDQRTATLASTRTEIDKRRLELQQLQCAIQQQHRQIKQQQADEREQQRRAMLTQTAVTTLRQKLDRMQQWSNTAQRTHSDSATQPLSALIEASSSRLQQLCRSVSEVDVETSEVEQMRSTQPLLTALRQRHIVLAVETQRLMAEAAEYDIHTAALPSFSSTSDSTLPLVQRDIAAHRALLQHVERLQAGDGREGVKAMKERLQMDTEEIAVLTARVSQRWTEVAAERHSRKQMRAAWQPYMDELQSDYQQHVQPLLHSLSTALTEQSTLMSAEWQQLHNLPLSITHRVAVQTAVGTTSTFLLPASSSSLQAVAAPHPMLRRVLDELPSQWYQSANTLLPSLVADHINHTNTHSATRHHSQLLLSALQNDRTLPTFSSLLASSAAVDTTHAATTASLNSLHASLSSLSQSAAHLSVLLQTQLQYGSLHLLPSLRVDGRGGREWIEQLSGLEAKWERQQQRVRERKEGQLREAQQRYGEAGKAATARQQHRYADDNYSKKAVQ